MTRPPASGDHRADHHLECVLPVHRVLDTGLQRRISGGRDDAEFLIPGLDNDKVDVAERSRSSAGGDHDCTGRVLQACVLDDRSSRLSHGRARQHRSGYDVMLRDVAVIGEHDAADAGMRQQDRARRGHRTAAGDHHRARTEGPWRLYRHRTVLQRGDAERGLVTVACIGEQPARVQRFDQ